MKSIEHKTGAYLDLGGAIVAPGGPVGVVAPTAASLQEVACLLARQRAGVSRTLVVPGGGRSKAGTAAAMEAGLRSLQADPATEIVVLVSEKLPASAAGSVLDLIRAADKPTVACFVGDVPRTAWKAGAIPATRLDEAAMRAAAWIRDWDQALVSSRLEEEADELAEQAAGLRLRVRPPQAQIYGILACNVLAEEACVMLSTGAGAALPAHVLHVASDPEARTRHLKAALADPTVAVILVDLWVDPRSDPDPAGAVASLVEGQGGTAPAAASIVAHVCGARCGLAQIEKQEARLRRAGAIIARSNAAAAQLARLIVAGTA